MKPRRSILALILLLALVGGLAWEFWPGENLAPSAKLNAPKPTNAPKPQPPTIAAVELPKIDPVKPRDTPAEDRPRTGMPDTPPTESEFVASYREQMQHDMQNIPVYDLGKVHLANGVPLQMTLNDTSPITITATLQPDGGVQFKLVVEKLLPNGRTTHIQMGSGSSIGKPVDFSAGGPDWALRIKFNPQVD